MFVVNDLGLAIAFCVVTMLGWGSWANTQKLAGKESWPFPLYYWDYALGVALFAVVAMFTLGSTGTAGQPALANLAAAEDGCLLKAFLSGVIFNISNILLVVAIDAAGMSVAFPVGVGLALVIGTVASYTQSPRGDSTLLFAGVALVVMAMLFSALAHSKLPRKAGEGWARGVVFSVVAGCLMGFFYPELAKTLSANFNTAPIQPGKLTPYTALLLFSIGLLVSNFAVNTLFMRSAKVTYKQYFAGSGRLHILGVAGGAIWMLALTLNVVASGVAGPAVSYALGQGATLVAAIWGVCIWREFREAPRAANPFIALMFAGYTAGLVLIGLATL
ncbi:MAG: multidrug DMT transporter permease [Bryobacterales bacterium]|nr:multidrug DMT transporter permease [Bryobacterales bacterium]